MSFSVDHLILLDGWLLKMVGSGLIHLSPLLGYIKLDFKTVFAIITKLKYSVSLTVKIVDCQSIDRSSILLQGAFLRMITAIKLGV